MSDKQPDQDMGQLRANWRQAQVGLSKHKLKTDAHLDLELLEMARGFPAWRGPVGVGFSWVLPQLPDFMERPDPIGRAILVGFGGIILMVSLWWMFKDATQWYRWWRARRDLANEKYDSRILLETLGLLGKGTLRPLPKDGEEWLRTGEWAQSDRQLRGVWEKWNSNPLPVRQHDRRVLGDAILALYRLRKKREEKEEQEEGKDA